MLGVQLDAQPKGSDQGRSSSVRRPTAAGLVGGREPLPTVGGGLDVEVHVGHALTIRAALDQQASRRRRNLRLKRERRSGRFDGGRVRAFVPIKTIILLIVTAPRGGGSCDDCA